MGRETVEEQNQIIEQLKDISNEISNLQNRVDNVNNSINNSGGTGIIGILILILLISINDNLRKLTRAIKDNKNNI